MLDFDTIEVKKINVSVVSLDGSVKTPGNYSFDDNASALRTIVQAGSLGDGVTADQVSVTVQRGGRTIPVNVEQAILDPATKDVPLEDKDILFVAFNPSPRVRLLGSVAKPDVYRLKDGATLMDAVAQAGGLALPPAQTSIRIVRTLPDGKQIPITVDSNRLFGQTDLSQNVHLQDGDNVYLSQYGGQIYVSGEVTIPNAYVLSPGEGFSELLLKAGGAKPTAALSQVSITSRDGSKRLVDASTVVAGGKVDIPLQEGDFVNVPVNPSNVVVWGAVTKVGAYPIPENQTLTLGQAIIQAGGTVPNARLKEVAVIHRLPDNTTKTDVVPVDAVKNGLLTIDYPLRSGDVVYVPEGRVSQSGISKATQFAGLFTLVSRLGGF